MSNLLAVLGTLIAAAVADYKLTIDLQEVKVPDGNLLNGQACDGTGFSHWCYPLISNAYTCSGCDIGVDICIEKAPGPDPKQCDTKNGGKLYSLGNLATGSSDVKVKHQKYSQWTNPQDVYVTGDFMEANIKLFIYDMDSKDGKNNQQIDFVQKTLKASDLFPDGKAKPLPLSIPHKRGGKLADTTSVMTVTAACLAGSSTGSIPLCRGSYHGTTPTPPPTPPPTTNTGTTPQNTGTTAPPTCEDKPVPGTKICAIMKQNGYCDFAKDFMETICQVTCGFTDQCTPAKPKDHTDTTTAKPAGM